MSNNDMDSSDSNVLEAKPPAPPLPYHSLDEVEETSRSNASAHRAEFEGWWEREGKCAALNRKDLARYAWMNGILTSLTGGQR